MINSDRQGKARTMLRAFCVALRDRPARDEKLSRRAQPDGLMATIEGQRLAGARTKAFRAMRSAIHSAGRTPMDEPMRQTDRPRAHGAIVCWNGSSGPCRPPFDGGAAPAAAQTRLFAGVVAILALPAVVLPRLAQRLRSSSGKRWQTGSRKPALEDGGCDEIGETLTGNTSRPER